MFVQFLCPFHKILRRFEGSREVLQHPRDGVPKRVDVDTLVQRLNCFLGGLLGGEACPFEISAVGCSLCML